MARIGALDPTYTYDSDGNMTAGASRSVSYTSFNMADTITVGTTATSFTYDSDHKRIKECVGSSCSTSSTIYLNDPASGSMSEKFVSGSTTTWHDYLIVDGKIIAQRSAAPSTLPSWGSATWGSFNWTATPAPANWNYFVLDHLGSVAVVTDDSGNVLSGTAGRLSYDAWGMPRNANGTDATCGAISSAVNRGFTNQEQIDSACLVNLNARIYDPAVGRFFSADPVVGDPEIPNVFNRYAYVLNNPLSFTDTTGLCFLGCFWNTPIFRDVLDIGLFFVALPELEAGFNLSVAAAFEQLGPAQLIANAVAAGGISAGVTGGNVLKGAAFGGLTEALTLGLGGPLSGALEGLVGQTAGDFIGQGIAGGIASVAEGGNFGSGFLSAGFGTLAGPLDLTPGSQFSPGGLIESAVLGGAGSVLGGGKFANGAVTGAFAYAASASYPSDGNDPANAAIGAGNNSSAAQQGQQGIPDRLVILNPAGENHGSYSIFYYRLVDANGNYLNGPGYALEEDVYPDYGPQYNSNYQFRAYPNGVFPDQVGWPAPVQGTYAHQTYTQSFVVEFQNNFYPLSTQTEHESTYSNGTYTNTDKITKQ